MEKRKLRINVMDVLILLLIAAAVAVVLYIFVWSGRKGGAETDTVTLRYVVEIMDMPETFESFLHKGDRVEDAVARGYMGNVVNLRFTEMRRAEYDSVTGKEVYPAVEGKSRALITIEADVTKTDRSYSIGGQDIYVGAKLSLMMPEVSTYGFCIELTEVGADDAILPTTDEHESDTTAETDAETESDTTEVTAQ